MTTITDSKVHEALLEAFKEFGIAQVQIEAKQAHQKDIGERMKDEFDIKPAEFKRMAKQYHDGRVKYEEKRNQKDEEETLFENVVKDSDF